MRSATQVDIALKLKKSDHSCKATCREWGVRESRTQTVLFHSQNGQTESNGPYKKYAELLSREKTGSIMKKWIRILWRSQPAWLRRFVLYFIANYFGQPLDPERPLLKGNVVVAGFLGTGTGLGEGARQMLREFQDVGIRVLPANVSRFAILEDFEGGLLWPDDAGPGGIVIFHVNPDILNLVICAIGRRRFQQRKIVGCWAWELDVVPRQWIRALRHVDEVWVPSHFIANALRKAAPDKPIHVVPYPMDVASVPTAPSQDPLPEFKGRTIVFFMYDVRSTHARKNPEAIIEAFRRATVGDETAVLVIKVHGEKAWPEAMARLRRAAEGCANIHILQKTFSSDAMRDLISRVDIVMSLHRSEGYGLLMAEAMAAAKPVIATRWSSNLDFMTPDCSVLVDAKLVPVVDPQNIYNKYGAMWAEPDIDQAAAALRRLLRDPAERRRIGQAAREHVMGFYSREKWFKSLPQSFWQALADEAPLHRLQPDPKDRSRMTA
jgi:glycosyltransferase involved in cell wall biosynthesis